MRVFVTGSTGFIGSHFINKGHAEEAEVIGLRRNKNSKTRIEIHREPIWITKQLDEVNHKDLEGVDVLVHLSAHSMYPPYDSLENCMLWNMLAPIKLFNKAIEAGVNKFVIAGSCFEYGESGVDFDKIPVDAPLKPTLSYAASKAAASIAFYQMAIEKKLELSIHRIFHVYGPGEAKNRLWPSLKEAAEKGLDFPMTYGQQIRDFIAVEDVVNVLWEYCVKDYAQKGKPIIKNLGTGKPMSIKEFSEKWWKKWNAKGKLLYGRIPYREGEVMRYVPEV